jgi:hypothetical protein
MNTKTVKNQFEPCCLATTNGSLPHTDAARATRLMLKSTPEIPSWVQFPKRDFHENMMMQFTEGLPALVRDGDRISFSTLADSYADQLTDFYERYMAATEAGQNKKNRAKALDSFGLSPQYAIGFSEFMARLADPSVSGAAVMLKGQVSGPFTLGTNLVDQNGRCAYYDAQLRDVIVKTVAMKAMWQMERLGAFGLPVMIFIDEPSLLGFGKMTFLSVSREDVIQDINEVTAVIHAKGGLAGVHCEENTDWSLLMETDLDVLDFDAYDHIQGITLYPAELARFFERGGCLGWGIVPTLDKDAAAAETVESLLARFEAGMEQFVAKGFDRELLRRRALITPSCGAGGVLTERLAERVLDLLNSLSATLRSRYGFSRK